MSEALTRYYIDSNMPANYLGAWSFGCQCEYTAGVPEGAIEIDSPPPLHASQTTIDGGLTWSEYPPAE